MTERKHRKMALLTELENFCDGFLKRCRAYGAADNRNAVAAISPALDDAVGLRWVTM